MKLDEIHEMWAKDSNIDITDLANQSIISGKLHAKYMRLFTEERLLLKKYEQDGKRLKLLKYEFYTMGPSKETQALGWEHPPRGMILKTEVPLYLDGDREIIANNLKVAMQQEKVDLLESIVRQIGRRGYDARNAIDFLKWSNGG